MINTNNKGNARNILIEYLTHARFWLKSRCFFSVRGKRESQLLLGKVYDLLDRKIYQSLQTNPSLIRQELEPGDKIIVIDEIQKIPALLDEVHLMIEEKQLIFLLTGSSARTLKRRGVNMLGGRARSRYLHLWCKEM